CTVNIHSCPPDALPICPSFIKKGVVLLRGRETDAELTVGTIDFIQINPQVKNGFPINSYQYKIDINFTDLQNKLEEEVYDVLLRSEEHTSELQSRENLV